MNSLGDRLGLSKRSTWWRFVLRLKWPQCRAKHPERRLNLYGRQESSLKHLCCTRSRFHFGQHIDMNGDRW